MIGGTREGMMSSSLPGQTKGKESCSFTEPVFTTVILTVIFKNRIMIIGTVYVNEAEHFLKINF